ncbi:gliding motility-associated C-terminal domain-containing protein, partial [Terrimonas pollutisoli]|uniref:T9SS type B sorting domain-containing protein n=1 Tax=Terrimonas pollutisoli TaxID=3034147 RepID=UPI0023EAEB1F
TAPVLPTTSNNGITGTWSPAVSTSAIGTTTYTFTPDAGQCAGTATLTITVTDQITPTFDPVNDVCLNATAPVLPTTSNNGITGTWSPAVSTAAIGTTTYTFTPDAGQCAGTATLAITVKAIKNSTTEITICSDQLPYSWNGQTYTQAGSYDVRLTSVAGCDSIATLRLTISPVPPTPIVVVTDITCATTGTITVTSPAPGTGIIYSIDGINFQASNVFTNVAPGTYTVSIKNAAGCSSSTTITVIQINNTIALDQTVTDAICTSNNGSINLAISDGAAPYTFAWSGPNNFTSTNEDLTSLSAGDYTVIVTDANGCTQTKTIKVGLDINTITINPVVANTICAANNGSINLVVQNGSAPYSYQWSGPNNFISTTKDLNGLAAGNYTVLVTDANGCTASSTTTINQVNNIITLNKSITNATCTVMDGSINLIVNGGSSPYSYAWTGPSGYTATTDDLTGLAPGNYSVVVTDANGCSATTEAVVGQTDLAPNVVTSDISLCSPANLTDPSVTAGSDNGLTYTYWLNAAATNPVANPQAVLAGTYYIKGTNAFGCYSIKPVTVTIESSPVFVVTNPASVCEPATVDLTAPAITAGSDPRLTYTYWMDQATTIPLTNPQTVNTSGTYYIKASAVGGCNFVKAVEVVVTVTKGEKSVRYPTITVAPNTSIQLTARALSLNNKYTWYPPVGLNAYDRKNPTFRHNSNVEYTITIDNGTPCPVVDTLLVMMRPINPGGCVSDIFVPKAWSPNNDGHNDKLFPIPVCIRELIYFRVFNRWGELVFETNILRHGWDGIYKGVPQVMDTYTWTLEATGEDGKYYKRAGNSVLLR